MAKPEEKHPTVEDWLQYVEKTVRKYTAERGHYGSIEIKFANGFVTGVQLHRGVKDPRLQRKDPAE